MFIEREKLKSDLKFFLIIVSVLIIIGMLFIYSSSSVYALEKLGSGHYYVKKQLIGLVLGIIALLITRFIPLEYIKIFSPYYFLGSLALTALTLIPAVSQRIHGSSRWINIAGFSFQPSELLKISFILYVAYFLSKREKIALPSVQSYLPLFIVLGITCGVLLLQPDFGLTVTLGATLFTLLFIAQFNLKYLLITLALAVPTAGGLIYFFPYRLKRILIFLNPWEDPQGAGFQIIQSLIAIGSGSMWGSGIANSKQKYFYLPMQHTDFIFSIIAEETGFVGSLLLITLFVLFLYFGLRIAWQLKDVFAIYTTLGFVILTSLQALINLCVTTSLLPTKGIGLPFISAGSSSLICSLAMIGIIINCAHETRL